jgi:hypothetical protein
MFFYVLNFLIVYLLIQEKTRTYATLSSSTHQQPSHSKLATKKAIEDHLYRLFIFLKTPIISTTHQTTFETSAPLG